MQTLLFSSAFKPFVQPRSALNCAQLCFLYNSFSTQTSMLMYTHVSLAQCIISRLSKNLLSHVLFKNPVSMYSLQKRIKGFFLNA